jgi:hypothetical protein
VFDCLGGLFFDRLDAPTVDVYGVEIVRTEVNAHALYHVRNRNYSPTFGRWNQKDPNASAQPVIDSAGWYHGVAPSAVDITFSHENLFGDGSNLFEYVGGNALVRNDALGLEWDPFDDMVDMLSTEHVASMAAFMERLSAGFDTAKYALWQVAQLHPAVAFGVSVYNLSTGQATWWDLASFILGAGLAKNAGRALSKASVALNTTRAAYGANRASMVGRTMLRGQKVLTLAADAVIILVRVCRTVKRRH